MSRFIDIHTHRTDHPEGVLSIRNWRIDGESELPTAGLFSAGIHPWDAGKAREEWLESIPAKNPRMAAIGEVGIDLYLTHRKSAKRQQWFFCEQINRANQLGKPLILHAVRIPDLPRWLRRMQVSVVIHGYTGGVAETRQLLREGCYLSFGQGLLASEKAQQSLETVPLNRLFFETDDHPAPIETIYEFAAARRDIPVEALKEQVEQNFRTLFFDLPDHVR